MKAKNFLLKKTTSPELWTNSTSEGIFWFPEAIICILYSFMDLSKSPALK